MKRSDSGIVRTDCSVEMTLDGRGVEVTWVRVTQWDYDANYGADADGNRGVPMWDYSDDEPERVVIEDYTAGTKTPIEALPKAQQALVDAAIDAAQRETDPNWPEDEPDEPPEEEPWEREERRREWLAAGD